MLYLMQSLICKAITSHEVTFNRISSVLGFAPYYVKNYNKGAKDMGYVKANDVLPKELLIEIQKYVQGNTLYIPKEKENRIKWGTNSGERKRIIQRNARIKEKFRVGTTITQLANDFFLSTETIKSIVYTNE